VRMYVHVCACICMYHACICRYCPCICMSDSMLSGLRFFHSASAPLSWIACRIQPGH
jgi:hypothetical protein